MVARALCQNSHRRDERPGDVRMLVQHFLNRAKRDLNKPDLERISPETLSLLVGYDWPGNVRQLRAVIRRCVLDSVMSVIVPDVLPNEITGRKSTPASQSASEDKAIASSGSMLPALIDRLLVEKSTNVYAEAVVYVERYALLRVLCATGGNQSQAAEILGITRGKLRDRISTYNIVFESGVTIKAPEQ